MKKRDLKEALQAACKQAGRGKHPPPCLGPEALSNGLKGGTGGVCGISGRRGGGGVCRAAAHRDDGRIAAVLPAVIAAGLHGAVDSSVGCFAHGTHPFRKSQFMARHALACDGRRVRDLVCPPARGACAPVNSETLVFADGRARFPPDRLFPPIFFARRS